MADGLILPWREYLKAAVEEPSSVARALLGVFGTNPTPAVIAGSNSDTAVLSFDDGGIGDIYHHLVLPQDWYPAGGLSARLFWITPATSGSARWGFYSSFAAAGATVDPVFNAGSFAVTAAAAAAGLLCVTDFAAIDVTGAAPGALCVFSVERDPTHGDDDLGDAANLIGLEFSYQRLIVLP